MPLALQIALLVPIYGLVVAAAWFLFLRPALSRARSESVPERTAREAKTQETPFPARYSVMEASFARVTSLEAELRGLVRRQTDLEESAEKRHRSLMGAIHGAKGGRPRSAPEEEPDSGEELPADIWAKLEAMQPASASSAPAPAPSSPNGTRLPRLVRRRDVQ